MFVQKNNRFCYANAIYYEQGKKARKMHEKGTGLNIALKPQQFSVEIAFQKRL